MRVFIRKRIFYMLRGKACQKPIITKNLLSSFIKCAGYFISGFFSAGKRFYEFIREM